MLKFFMQAIHNLGSLSIDKADSKDEIFKKRMLVLITVIVTSAGFLWGLAYISIGLYLPASLPILYALISTAGILHLFKTKKLFLFQVVQLYSILIIPFALMWSLGGFTAGSFVMIWAFYAPIASVVYADEGSQKRLLIAFFAFILFSLLIDDYLSVTMQAPSPLSIKIFFGLNLIGSLGGIQLLMSYFASMKKRDSDIELEKQHAKVVQKGKELLELNQKLEHQIAHDELTKLPNRLLLLERMNNNLHHIARCETCMAVLVIDLDRFKEINDSLGHTIGDKVLIQIGKNLMEIVRKSDTVARLGGDEFSILLTNIKNSDFIISLAEAILQRLQEPLYIDDHELYITSSIGITLYPQDADSANILLRNADSAMNKAKERGKNQYAFYTKDMTERANYRVSLERQLRHAIEEEEFVVYYQPQYNVKTNTLVGMEGLVRWISPENGFVSPGEFIPLAEDTGLIVTIDRIVMKKAIKQFNEWLKMGLNPGRLSLNLAMKQLEKEDLVSFLRRQQSLMFNKNNFMDLEVTEGHIMKNPKKAIAILNKINALGINLAIDDFGTGYSSLSYLKGLPVNKLKIDQSFVAGLPEDKDDASIVKSVIALAKGMNMSIIAEGVETQEQSDFLLASGCENIQGYFYGRPMKAEDMLEVLQKLT